MNNFICISSKVQPFGYKGDVKVYPSHPSYFFIKSSFIVYNKEKKSSLVLKKYHENIHSFVLSLENSLDFSQGIFLKREDFPLKKTPYPSDYPFIKIKNYTYQSFYLNGANQDILVLLDEKTKKIIEVPFLEEFFDLVGDEYQLKKILFF